MVKVKELIQKKDNIGQESTCDCKSKVAEIELWVRENLYLPSKTWDKNPKLLEKSSQLIEMLRKI